MVTIHIKPEDIWQFFESNKKRLDEEMALIAESDKTGYNIYLSRENGTPMFSVCKGDDEAEYEELAVGRADCAKTAKYLYREYLYSTSDNPEDDDWPDDDALLPVSSRQEELISDRETELLYALADFLVVATNDTNCADGSDYVDLYGSEAVSELLDETLDMLGTTFGVEIYRPTIMYDDVTGEETIVEYPYNDPDYY